jgi:hypothetical protein
MDLQPFAPVVNVFDKGFEDGIVRIVSIECPGVHEEDATWEQSENGVVLTISKSLLVDTPEVATGAVRPLEPLRQQFGVYTETFLFPDFTFQEDCTLERGVLTMTWRKHAVVRRGSGRRLPQQFFLTPRPEDAEAPFGNGGSIPPSLDWSDRDQRSEVDSTAPAPETPPDFGAGNEVVDATYIATVVPAVVARIERQVSGLSSDTSRSVPPLPLEPLEDNNM